MTASCPDRMVDVLVCHGHRLQALIGDEWVPLHGPVDCFGGWYSCYSAGAFPSTRWHP